MKKGYTHLLHSVRTVTNLLPACLGAVVLEFVARSRLKYPEVTYQILMDELGGSQKTYQRACKTLLELNLITRSSNTFVLSTDWEQTLSDIGTKMSTQLDKNVHPTGQKCPPNWTKMSKKQAFKAVIDTFALKEGSKRTKVRTKEPYVIPSLRSGITYTPNPDFENWLDAVLSSDIEANSQEILESLEPRGSEFAASSPLSKSKQLEMSPTQTSAGGTKIPAARRGKRSRRQRPDRTEKPPKAPPAPRKRNPFFDALCVASGYPLESAKLTKSAAGRVVRALGELRDAGYTAEDVPKITAWLLSSCKWQPSMVNPNSIAREAPAWSARDAVQENKKPMTAEEWLAEAPPQRQKTKEEWLS
jgi:hypothetical protein